MDRGETMIKMLWLSVIVFLSVAIDVTENAKHLPGSVKELSKLYSGDIWKYVSNQELLTSRRFDQMESRMMRTLEERIRQVNHSASIEYLERFMQLLNEQLTSNEEQLKTYKTQVDELLLQNQQQENRIKELKQNFVELQKTAAQECRTKEVTDMGESQTTISVSQTTPRLLPIDCQKAFDSEENDLRGIHYRQIRPRLSEAEFKACCFVNQSSEAWTVIQRRFDGSVEFYRSWDEYKEGFGDVEGGEFWLGNDHIYQLTNQGGYRLRIEMKTWDDDTHWAEYRHFRIADETDKYRLHVSGYHGNAGNSLSSQWDNDHNGQQFSTYDSDNDERFYDNCAEHYRGAWWFRSCFKCHLNGVYYPKGLHSNFFVRNGIQWNSIHPHSSLKEVTMMIRADDDDVSAGISNGIEQEA